MFTGIIENLAKVAKVEKSQSNLEIYIESTLASELKVDQSVAHNGVCLTVVEIFGDRTYRVTAIEETIDKTNLGDLTDGDSINLERCMTLGARLDGHIVQGHVDQIGICENIQEKDGSWIYTFSYDTSMENVTVEKPSKGVFSVAIIPYTYENTVFNTLSKGDRVNLEFDVIGKYVARMMEGYKG